MSRFLKLRILILAFLLGLVFFLRTEALASDAQHSLTIFHSPSCHSCLKAKAEILPGIEQRFSGRVRFEYQDFTSAAGHAYYLALKEKYAPQAKGLTLPIFYMGGSFLGGQDLTSEALASFIEAGLSLPPDKPLNLPSVNLIERFKSFSPLLIAGAGLVDGFNPCAFTVIVFFVSFLSLQGYRRRDVLIIGTCFSAAVFLTYLLIGLGIFQFLYLMKGFWTVSRFFNKAIGVFSLGLGCLSLYDWVRFIQSSRPEAFILKLPESVKARMQRVVGKHYRRDNAQKQSGRYRHLWGLALSAWVTGFIVSLLEAICTGQSYLPTISFILNTSSLKALAFAYLILYNIMFVAPLFLVLALALVGTDSARVTGVFRKHAGLIKILMALFFLLMGGYLLWY